MNTFSQKIDDYTNEVLKAFKGALVKDSIEDTERLEVSLEFIFDKEFEADYSVIKKLLSVSNKSFIRFHQEPETDFTIDNQNKDSDEFSQNIKFLCKNDPISILYKINKTKDSKVIEIYDKNLFNKWANSNDCKRVLEKIRKRISDYEGLSISIDEKQISLIEKPEKNDLTNELIRQNCRFMDFKDFPFNAFWFQKSLNIEPELAFCQKIKEILFVFLLANIFDFTDFKEDLVVFRLTGNKLFKTQLRFDSINTSSIITYWQIFEWIYTKETDKISDALSIARNILSVYLIDSIDVDDGIVNSIKSNYKIYLQKNIDKYFELKLKLSEQLNKALDSLNLLSDKYLSTFKSNFFAGLSFYTSLFLMNFLKTEKGAFSRETILFSFGYFVFSILYLVISSYYLNKDYSNLNKKYELLKNRYKDLLVEEDINKILSNDIEYKEAKKYFEEKRLHYSLLWFITVSFLAILAYYASEYWCNHFKYQDSGFWNWLFGI